MSAQLQHQAISPELRTWIREQRAQGFTREQVLAAMINSGWQESVALRALDLGAPVAPRSLVSCTGLPTFTEPAALGAALAAAGLAAALGAVAWLSVGCT